MHSDAPQQYQQVNARKLYVGNLPYSTTDSDLHQMFGQYGEVTSASIVTDRMSGRSKGFGFVEFADEAAAAQAAEATNGMDMGGRNLVVNVARPLAPRTDRPSFGGGSRGGFRNDRGGNDRRGGGRDGGYSRGR